MDKKTNNLIGRCGFYCGSCPTYVEGKCTGCRTAHNKGDCYTFDCVHNKRIDYCGLCEDFPCNEIMTREKATVLDLRWLEWKKSQKNDKNKEANYMGKFILVIMGSPRREGNTDTIAETLVTSIQEDINVKKIDLSQFQFRGCRGCRKCFSDGVCKFEDDMNKIYPLVEKADGLIFVSPTYNYNVTAEMKAFIDRLFCFYDFTNKGRWTSRLGDKRKALIFGLCAGSSEEDMGFTLKAMERPIKALGIQVIKTVPYFDTKLKPVWRNEEFIEKLNTIGKEFVHVINE